MREAGSISSSFWLIAASVAPLEMPTSSPSSHAQRSAMALASSASTAIAPSIDWVCRLVGMKPPPMPWIGCGLGWPPLMTGDAAGSTA